MKLVNKTKDSVLAKNLRQLKTFNEKSVGLLKHKRPEPVYFQTRWGLHTFGMDFPIDCIICNNNFQVKKLKKKLKPGKFFAWNPFYKNVFELPPGTISQTNTEIHDQLKLTKN